MRDDCICLRPPTLVMCRSCGWMCPKKRVRRICKIHPRTLYLMDIAQCAQCLSYPPIIAEYPMEIKNNKG